VSQFCSQLHAHCPSAEWYATIRKLWQRMPNTPGKEQGVVGERQSRRPPALRSRPRRFSRGPRSTMALGTFLLTGLRI